MSAAWRLTTSLIVLLGWLCLALQPASAHEVRPAYLELKEISPGVFDVFFKTPMRGNARLSLAARFPGEIGRAHV